MIDVRQPRVALAIQVLSVDPRTLVTTARLTNNGDTLTDLALDIVQQGTGIPANFVIQPDIQHTYLLAGQSLEIAFIPLDLQDAASPAPDNASGPQFDPLTGASLDTPTNLVAIPGPYVVTANARNTTIDQVPMSDGTLTNTCGVASDPERTVAAECTTPAGSETRVANDWYCTNRPNIDVPIALALPNGGLGVPITNVSVGANFSPGSGTVYSHSTTVSLNGSVVGSAVVPTQSRIDGGVAPQALVLGGSTPTQTLNLRSTHTNNGHYSIASGFTVTVEYDEHTRTGCFTQSEVDAAAGGTLMCTVDSSLVVPVQALNLNLTIDPEAEAIQSADGAFVFTVGEEIPLIAEVSAVGQTNIGGTVHIELTVPRGLVPQGMTIQDEESSLLETIFISLAQFLSTLGLPFSQNFDNGLGVTGDDQQVTFTYDYDRDLVIGQPFPITLDVVGEVPGDFTISGQASIGSPSLSSQMDIVALAERESMASSTPQLSNLLAVAPPLVIRITAPTCLVTIAGHPDFPVLHYYRTPLDLLSGNFVGFLPAGTEVVIVLRSYIDNNIVAFDLPGDSQRYWFYSGAGNVTQSDLQAEQGSCSDLDVQPVNRQSIEDELATNYGILLRSEPGTSWSDREVREIYAGVGWTSGAVERFSSSAQPAFNRIMFAGDVLPHIVLYKAIGTPQTAAGVEESLTVTFDVPDPAYSVGGNTAVPQLNVSFLDVVTNGGCRAFQGSGSDASQQPIPRTIVCNFLPPSINTGYPNEFTLAGVQGQTNQLFSQYVLVHELGHIFDNRSKMVVPGLDCDPSTDSPGDDPCGLIYAALETMSRVLDECPDYLSDRLTIDGSNYPDAPGIISCIQVYDERNLAIMGNSTSTRAYSRRDRGWGTSPDNLFTDFQQHPREVFSGDGIMTVIDEEAADLFLNWVYRVNVDVRPPTSAGQSGSYPIPPVLRADTPGSWLGLRNIRGYDLFLNSTGVPTATDTNRLQDDIYAGEPMLAGNLRMIWMSLVMDSIFTAKGW